MENISIGEYKRLSILSAFEKEIVKGDENHFSNPELFYKAVADNKWLVYSEDDLKAFDKALNEQLSSIEKGGEGNKEELIEKAKLDKSKLHLKHVVSNKGFVVKRWVSNGGTNEALEASENSKQSHQQLLDEKIEKKNQKQMTAHREDMEDEHEKALNELAHEVVEEVDYDAIHDKLDNLKIKTKGYKDLDDYVYAIHEAIGTEPFEDQTLDMIVDSYAEETYTGN